MKKETFFIKTYGCQMNNYDSDKISSLFLKENYTNTNKMEQANIVIFNTCAIREKAKEKLFSDLGKIKHKNKRVIITGCISQIYSKEISKRTPWVNIITGPQSYHKIINLIQDDKATEISDYKLEKFDIIPHKMGDKHPSEFITIQEGCNNFCSFCIVPFTRGREISRSIDDIYKEALYLSKNDVTEIILLGQNVNAYKHNDQSISDLINKISEIPEIKRINYTTSYPTHMTDELIQLHKNNEKLIPFLHLPVQSGSNEVLKKMNRKYTIEEYTEIINKLKQAKPDIAISSDFIVGFPEETDKDFDETLSLVEKVQFAQSFSFKYSPRPRTLAARMKQLEEPIKHKRLIHLQKELLKHQLNFNKPFEGKTVEVLIHNIGNRNPNQIIGKTKYMQNIYINNVKHPQELIGKIIQVKVEKVLTHNLEGKLQD